MNRTLYAFLALIIILSGAVATGAPKAIFKWFQVNGTATTVEPAVNFAGQADGGVVLTATNDPSMKRTNIVANIPAKGVTKAMAAFFASDKTLCTGAAQNIAHGLAAVPAAVWFSTMIGYNDLDAGVFTGYHRSPTITEGTHTSTNVVVTCTAGAYIKAMAWK